MWKRKGALFVIEIITVFVAIWVLAPGPARAATIAVTDFANYRVFQRDLGGTSKSVTVSGTYSSMNWNRVEARVLQHGTFAAVVDWTTIDSTPGGGTFSGNLTVPQGGWYDVEIRALDAAGSVIGSSRGTNKWGVGMIILCIGQSNMSGHGRPPFTIANSDLAVNYSNAGRWEHLADPYDDESPTGAVDNDNITAGGSMIPALGNSLLETFNFPIAFVPSAKDGSNLYSQWAYRNPNNHYDTNTLYGQSITKAQRVGGVELIIMHQGEADTNAHRTEAQYEADFATMIGHYRQDLYATIPIFICQLGTISIEGGDPRTDADVVAVRNAQHDLDNGEDIFMAATAMDQPRIDDVHYTTQGLNAIGGRIAQTIKYYLGAASYCRGPAITSVFFADANRNTVDIRIGHRGGTNITPVSGITGFSLLKGGSPVSITSAVRLSADRIRLTLASAIPQGTTATLRYLWGSNPVTSALVKDNSSLALPLENTTADITVTATIANHPPVATPQTLTTPEDASVAVTLSGSDVDGDTPLTFAVVGGPSHGTLSGQAPALTYTPVPDYYGPDAFTFVVNDGLVDSAPATVTITVSPVNDAPGFVKGPDTEVLQNTGPQTAPSWATAISSGPAESTQTVEFIVSLDKPYLFSVPPAIDARGNLSFTPAQNLRGTALITVWLRDNGGQANGGQDTSLPQTFMIAIGSTTDSNRNGLPDDWEMAYGLALDPPSDASADEDGDGYTNLQEYAAGTDPRSPNSSPAITDIGPVPAGLMISFKTVLGKRYAVDYQDGDLDGSWTLLADGVNGTGTIAQAIDETAENQARRFYRVRLLP